MGVKPRFSNQAKIKPNGKFTIHHSSRVDYCMAYRMGRLTRRRTDSHSACNRCNCRNSEAYPGEENLKDESFFNFDFRTTVNFIADNNSSKTYYVILKPRISANYEYNYYYA